jgi:hypothetical protein
METHEYLSGRGGPEAGASPGGRFSRTGLTTNALPALGPDFGVVESTIGSTAWRDHTSGAASCERVTAFTIWMTARSATISAVIGVTRLTTLRDPSLPVMGRLCGRCLTGR